MHLRVRRRLSGRRASGVPGAAPPAAGALVLPTGSRGGAGGPGGTAPGERGGSGPGPGPGTGLGAQEARPRPAPPPVPVRGGPVTPRPAGAAAGVDLGAGPDPSGAARCRLTGNRALAAVPGAPSRAPLRQRESRSSPVQPCSTHPRWCRYRPRGTTHRARGSGSGGAAGASPVPMPVPALPGTSVTETLSSAPLSLPWEPPKPPDGRRRRSSPPTPAPGGGGGPGGQGAWGGREGPGELAVRPWCTPSPSCRSPGELGGALMSPWPFLGRPGPPVLR